MADTSVVELTAEMARVMDIHGVVPPAATLAVRAVATEAVVCVDADRLPWRCFHCDEKFTDWGAARNHFGYTPEDGAPVCRVDGGTASTIYHLKRQVELLQKDAERLRRMEAALEFYANGGSLHPANADPTPAHHFNIRSTDRDWLVEDGQEAREALAPPIVDAL